MTHLQHIELIKKAVPQTVSTCVDLGSGEGAFTLALAGLLLSESKICSKSASFAY